MRVGALQQGSSRDRAIAMIRDIEKEHGYQDQRFRIEHPQHVAQENFQRFTRLHVIASMQSYHAIDDGRGVLEVPRPRLTLQMDRSRLRQVLQPLTRCCDSRLRWSGQRD